MVLVGKAAAGLRALALPGPAGARGTLRRRRPRPPDPARPRPGRVPVGGARRRSGSASGARPWRTLRVAFLSALVLELAATLGRGARRGDGRAAARRRRDEPRGRADGPDARARALRPAAAARRPTTTRAPTAWRPPSASTRCSTSLPLIDRARNAAARCPTPPPPRSGSRAWAPSTRAATSPALRDVDLTDRARASAWPWWERAAPARARCSPSWRASPTRPTGASRSAGSTCATATPRPGAGAWPGCPSGRRLIAAPWRENVRMGDPGRPTPRVRAALRTANAAGAGRARCPRASTPGSARAGARCRPARRSGSRWRGPSCATRRSCCSTSRRRTSTPRGPPWWRTRSSACAAGAPSVLAVHRLSLARSADRVVVLERGAGRRVEARPPERSLGRRRAPSAPSCEAEAAVAV